MKKQLVSLVQELFVTHSYLLEEMQHLRRRWIIKREHIVISDRAQMLMPYHRYQDQLRRSRLPTVRSERQNVGIGPCYADKYARRGNRFHEFINFETFKVRLKEC